MVENHVHPVLAFLHFCSGGATFVMYVPSEIRRVLANKGVRGHQDSSSLQTEGPYALRNIDVLTETGATLSKLG